MIRKEDVYKIGKINKPHGVKGEMSFTFSDDIFDRKDGDYLLFMIDGILVPFFIEEYKFKSDSSAIIKFEGIDSVEKARNYINIDVYYPKQEAEDDEMPNSLNYFIGFNVLDSKHGHIGEIIDIDDSTSNLLLIVENMDKEEIMIPFHEDFIIGFDNKEKTIELNLPDGIIDIDNAEEIEH